MIAKEKKKSYLLKLATLFKKINYFGFIVSAILVFIMSVFVFYGVIMRYLFNAPLSWVHEISGYLIVVTAFLGSGYTLYKDGHVRIDSLDSIFPKSINNLLFILRNCIIIFFSFVLIWYGTQMVLSSFETGRKASTILGTPLYIPQLFIPLGGLLLLIQSIGLIIENRSKHSN